MWSGQRILHTGRCHASTAPEKTVYHFEGDATGLEDVLDIFTRQFHFGCEADDPMNAMAFDTSVNPHGARLRGVFASDIGHWDVPDFTGVLPEAWELIEDDLVTRDQFSDFMFGNVARLFTGTNPQFFDGTAVESQVRQLLADEV